MTAVEADVWVLTEAHAQVAPGPEYELVARSTPIGADDPDDCWVAIWSRVGGAAISVSVDDRASAFELPTDEATPLAVYGPVLPWLGSAWRDAPAIDGHAFAACLAAQAKDWATLSQGAHLCVAGDFNQDLLKAGHYYGSKRNRDALRNALAGASLTCPTADPVDHVWKHSGGLAAGVDHICLSPGLSQLPHDRTAVWPAPEQRSARLSDHFGSSLRVTIA